MREKDKRYSRDLPVIPIGVSAAGPPSRKHHQDSLFELFELLHVKRLIPADIYEDFYAAIKLQDRLRRGRL